MKIICTGRNYAKHIEELANERPDNPVVFLKPDSAILPKKNPFFIPPFSKDVHYEVEVLVKINKVGKHIATRFAHKYYDEIGLGIDFTARDLQKKLKDKGLPWEKSKAFDNSAPIGKKFIPVSSINNLNNINFHLDINGKTVQKGNTSDMMFKINDIIAEVSKYITLKTGDLIYTGTPEGVSPVKIGDNLKAYFEGECLLDFDIK